MKVSGGLEQVMSEACPPTFGSKRELTLLGKVLVFRQAGFLGTRRRWTVSTLSPPRLPQWLALSNSL